MQKKRFDPDFVVAMTWCFQPECNLHQNYFKLSNQQIDLLVTRSEQWRHELKVGSKVDVRVIGDSKRKTASFMQGEIVDMQEDLISVMIIDSAPEFDTTLSKWSTNVMPFESQTKEWYTWIKEDLENCQEYVLDVHDKFNWEEATILKIRKQSHGDRVYTEAYVVFRVYRPTSKPEKKYDLNGREFDGWSEKFDEWIPIYSPRMQKHMTHVGGRHKTMQENSPQEYLIDDKIKPA